MTLCIELYFISLIYTLFVSPSFNTREFLTFVSFNLFQTKNIKMFFKLSISGMSFKFSHKHHQRNLKYEQVVHTCLLNMSLCGRIFQAGIYDFLFHTSSRSKVSWIIYSCSVINKHNDTQLHLNEISSYAEPYPKFSHS